MSNSIYINASAASSEMLDKENFNSYEYKLGDGIYIPRGSTVQIQNTFINSQGITGASITIDEDIEEEILIGYYYQDTSFMIPRAEATTLTAHIYDFPESGGMIPEMPELYSKCNYQANLETLRTGNITNFVAFETTGEGNIEQYTGYTENPLPICTSWNDAGTYRMQPLTCKIKINVPKGVYSVSKLTDLLTEQINNRDINNNNINTVQFKKNNGQFEGTIQNNGTNLAAKVSKFTEIQSQRNNTEPPASTPNNAFKRALTVEDNFLGDVVGITPFNFNTLLDGFKKKNYSPFANENMVSPDFSWPQYIDNEYIKFFGVQDDPSGGIVSQKYDLFSYGHFIGSTDVKFDYSSVKGGFSIGGLSQIRRIPTNAPFGTKNSSEGQTCIYLKRVRDAKGINDPIFYNGGNNGNTPEAQQAIFNTINNVMSRIGGIYVLNWAMNHTKNTCEVDLNEYNVDFMKFEDYYLSESSRNAAWNSCWLSRLGFSYNDLNKVEKYKTYDLDIEQVMPGFTQDNTIDSSSITTISTQYNDINYGGKKAGDTDDGTGQNVAYEIPGVKSLQTFNMVDVALPCFPVNNNNLNFPNGDGGFSKQINIMQYSNSFYPYACMFPILTDTATTIASNLPILNVNPYYIISSDIVSKSDIFNGNKNLPLLGVVPVSSLSNEDFIYSAFSEIIAPITNDKFINSLSITILNSDLSVPKLGAFSSVILKITFPDEPLSLQVPRIEPENNKSSDDTPQKGADDKKKDKK